MIDLIDILERSLTPAEIIEQLINTNFNLEDLKDYAVKHNICPKCCTDLVVHTWEEPREHFGYMTSETMSELRCDNCGWVLD